MLLNRAVQGTCRDKERRTYAAFWSAARLSALHTIQLVDRAGTSGAYYERLQKALTDELARIQFPAAT